MNVQPRRKDRIKIGHFSSVLFRRAGNIISATKGKEMIRRKSASGNPLPQLHRWQFQLKYHSEGPDDKWNISDG